MSKFDYYFVLFALSGGVLYFVDSVLKGITIFIDFIAKIVRSRKAKKEIDSISRNLSAEIDKFLNQIGKEERL